jgi:hypothetical protein
MTMKAAVIHEPASSHGLFEHRAKALHGGTSEPCLRYDEIIVLVLRGAEVQSVLPGDHLDRDSPIGSVLRDGNTHGVVRFRLRPVTSGLGASELLSAPVAAGRTGCWIQQPD